MSGRSWAKGGAVCAAGRSLVENSLLGPGSDDLEESSGDFSGFESISFRSCSKNLSYGLQNERLDSSPPQSRKMPRIVVALALIHCVFGAESFFPEARIANNPTIDNPVRRFLKHYNSLKPVALLVDDTAESTFAAKEFLKEALEAARGTKQIQYFVSKFNETGASTPIGIPGTDAESIYALIDGGTGTENSELGHKKSPGSVLFFATWNAVAAMPPDGAALIFTDRNPTDEDLAQHAEIVRKKNIKVYVIWGGPLTTNDQHLLKELCSFSGGLFLTEGVRDLSSYNYRRFINSKSNTSTSVLVLKRNVSSPLSVPFPVDSEVTCVELVLQPAPARAALVTPTGRRIDVADDASIAGYGAGSFGVRQPGGREVRLQDVAVGAWRLDVEPPAGGCNVSVFACTGLTASAHYVFNKDNGTSKTNRKIKLDLEGHLKNINNIAFIDPNGNLINNDIEYNITSASEQNKNVNIEFKRIPNETVQLLVQGTDIEGNKFSRLTYVNNNFNSNNPFPQQTVLIDVGVGSQLITTGGRSSIITFEVTNLKNTAVDARFYCSDERSILGSLQPIRTLIAPKEMAVVTLTLSVKYGSYQDLITFVVSVGSEFIYKRVVVDVGTSQVTSDKQPPYLDYSYLSDCSKVVFSNCEQGTWTIEAKAKDSESGLLQLTSNPKGLYIENGFTTGTTEEVSGIYSDSCCNADLQLTAIDRANNRRTITVNAFKAAWGPGPIAALVLGIILLILLIVLIVYLIRKCLKKRENYNLPTYRGRI
ncbi:unnamed protein product [Phyllotreta striolata]|uniref:VWFA domain-containing protein n=1 Tax=Phyllotreta striolata TaxID=444603 RepID=A0A9N9XN40_PHYSR|nr:unnamed protein product [Phyllotreta striolata]